jgi:hypothetical protein
MVPPPRSEGPPIARWEQSLLTLAGLSGLILLSLAIWLEPNPSGFGTHQQLGLPPCTILFWFDVPCPSCGGTTAFAHFVRGQWAAAVRANAAAAAFAGLCVVGVPWSWASAWQRRYLGVRDIVVTLTVVMLVLIALSITQWVGRLQGWLP